MLGAARPVLAVDPPGRGAVTARPGRQTGASHEGGASSTYGGRASQPQSGQAQPLRSTTTSTSAMRSRHRQTACPSGQVRSVGSSQVLSIATSVTSRVARSGALRSFPGTAPRTRGALELVEDRHRTVTHVWSLSPALT